MPCELGRDEESPIEARQECRGRGPRSGKASLSSKCGRASALPSGCQSRSGANHHMFRSCCPAKHKASDGDEACPSSRRAAGRRKSKSSTKTTAARAIGRLSRALARGRSQLCAVAPNHTRLVLNACHAQLCVSASAMARFRAYVTDSEEEDEDDVSMELPPPKPVPVAAPQELREDDSMDEDDLRPTTRPQAALNEVYSEEEEEEEEDAEEDDESEDSEEDGRRRGRNSAQPPRGQLSRQGDPTIIPWAREIGVDPQKMHVMQTSLFRMPEEERALKALNEPQPRRKLLQLKSALTRKHSRDSEGEGLRADSRQVRVSYPCAREGVLKWRILAHLVRG